jgi:hypothetical protein
VLGKQTNHRAFRPNEARPALDWLAEAVPFDIQAARERAGALIRAAQAAVKLSA